MGVFSSFVLPLDPTPVSKGKQFQSNKIRECQSSIDENGRIINEVVVVKM
jgi:hypothetical protein